MKRYLVTGAAGFIGSTVAQQLLDAGHAVVGIDNLNDAYDPRLKQWRLERLLPRQNFTFHAFDIADRDAVAERFAEDAAATGFDCLPYSAVINLAARAGVRPSVEDPWVYFQANTTGTLNLLESCRRRGVKKFVLASSSSLYGATNPVPFAEDADTNQPVSPYAASKKAAETLCYSYHHLHGLDVTVFRYFTVYGPAGRPDMSVFRFVRWIAEGHSLTLYGDGTQKRDFTYVDDIARGTIAGLKPVGYEVINLGGDRPIAISAVITQLGNLLGKQPKIDHRPAHPADVPATWANVEKARNLLDWQSRIGIEEGLGRCVTWYQENRDLASTLDLGAG